jgi:hypothetical protein
MMWLCFCWREWSEIILSSESYIEWNPWSNYFVMPIYTDSVREAAKLGYHIPKVDHVDPTIGITPNQSTFNPIIDSLMNLTDPLWSVGAMS